MPRKTTRPRCLFGRCSRRTPSLPSPGGRYFCTQRHAAQYGNQQVDQKPRLWHVMRKVFRSVK